MLETRDKCRNETEQNICVPDSGVKRRVRGRHERLVGLITQCVRGKMRGLLEWQICWAKALIRPAMLSSTCQSTRLKKAAVEWQPLKAACGRANAELQLQLLSPWLNIYDNHKGESSGISNSHPSLRPAALFPTILSITCVNLLYRFLSALEANILRHLDVSLQSVAAWLLCLLCQILNIPSHSHFIVLHS